MSMLSYEIVTCFLFTGAQPPLMQILSFQELKSKWCQNSDLPMNRIYHRCFFYPAPGQRRVPLLVYIYIYKSQCLCVCVCVSVCVCVPYRKKGYRIYLKIRSVFLCKIFRGSYCRYFHFDQGPFWGSTGPILTDPLKCRIPVKIQILPILMKFKLYVLDTK